MNYEKVLATAKEQLEAAREKASSEQFEGPVMATLVQWRAMRTRVAKLEAALKPFADDVESWGSAVPDDHVPVQIEMGHWDARYYGSPAKYNIGDLRHAKALLDRIAQPAESGGDGADGTEDKR